MQLPEPEENKKPLIVPGQIPDEEKATEFVTAKNKERVKLTRM